MARSLNFGEVNVAQFWTWGYTVELSRHYKTFFIKIFTITYCSAISRIFISLAHLVFDSMGLDGTHKHHNEDIYIFRDELRFAELDVSRWKAENRNRKKLVVFSVFFPIFWMAMLFFSFVFNYWLNLRSKKSWRNFTDLESRVTFWNTINSMASNSRTAQLECDFLIQEWRILCMKNLTI